MIGDTGNNFELAWDNNGRQTSQLSNPAANYKLEYDYEGRLREGWAGGANDKMIAKYTPGGARVYKERIWSDDIDYKHKYIVDIAGKLPKILVVLDANNNDAVIKKYIHAQDQVIAQHDIINDTSTPPEVVSDNLYFYLHDRLGSVRQIIDTNGDVVNAYTYDPWGLPIESATDNTIGKETKENISNLYQFANYIYDAEIKMYYCNAREYDPILARFTSTDPVLGTFENPMTLHAYLYCVNDPVNKWDPSGKSGILTGWAEKFSNFIISRNIFITQSMKMSKNSFDAARYVSLSNNFHATFVGVVHWRSMELAKKATWVMQILGHMKATAMAFAPTRDSWTTGKAVGTAVALNAMVALWGKFTRFMIDQNQITMYPPEWTEENLLYGLPDYILQFM